MKEQSMPRHKSQATISPDKQEMIRKFLEIDGQSMYQALFTKDRNLSLDDSFSRLLMHTQRTQLALHPNQSENITNSSTQSGNGKNGDKVNNNYNELHKSGINTQF